MEQKSSVVTPPISETPSANLPGNGFINKIKNLSKKQKIAGIIALLVIVGIITWFFIRSMQNPGSEVIATVGSTKLPRAYLDLELFYYPATQTAEIKKALTEKIVDDQITLEEGKKDGYITDFPSGTGLTKEEYLKRTKLVKEVKNKVNASGNMIKGKLISVWFYNNAYVGPKGLEAGKKIAYAKIKPLYDQVQNGSITIEQAGEQIAGDESLLEIDQAYKGNAINSFTFYKGGTGTFWQEFNDIIWRTEQGQITPLYLGGGILRDGKPTEELYIFAKIDEKSTNPSFNNYEDWLEKKKNGLGVSISDAFSYLNSRVTKQVYADDNDNTMRSGSWGGFVETETGAGIASADAAIVTRCTGASGRHMTTDGRGYFNTGTDANLSCVCTPHNIGANTPNLICQTFTYYSVGNPVAEISQDIVCRVPPPPPPPPPPTPPPPTPACNVSCSSNEFCATAPDGCTSCIGGTCQKCEPKPAETRTLACPPGHTGSITETRTYTCPAGTWSNWTATSNSCTPPPACGDNCTTDSYCFGAPDGCTSCVPNNAGTGSICSKPPVCGSSCVRDDQCIGDAAKNGCTACVSGTCRTPPSCGTACTTKAECSGAKDNCSECLEGTCTDYNDNMCKCDGIVADLTYPSNAFKFEAFGKVEGSDVKKAEIADITFRLTKDNQVVAKSNPITPEVVENSANKLRFKAAWQTAPPAVSKGSTYRVFADVRCKPKRIVADASQTSSPVPVAAAPVKTFAPKGLELIASAINNLSGNNNDQIKALTSKVLAFFSTPTANAQTNDGLQLKTLNFVKLMDTDNCRFVMFKYDETLF